MPFFITQGYEVTPKPAGETMNAAELLERQDGTVYLVTNRSDLERFILDRPGERAVELWNKLPGVTRIQTAKFRNRGTAVERIWRKLAELYPGAMSLEDTAPTNTRAARAAGKSRPGSQGAANPAKPRRRSPWADELRAVLMDFAPGKPFTVQDVYSYEKVFKRRHHGNRFIQAKIRQTLAVLRGDGFLKQMGRGKYARKATR